MNILIAAAQIERRIVELAAEIEADYPSDEEIHLVGVLKGGFMFMADLVRAMSARVTLDFIAVSSYSRAPSRPARSACSRTSTPASKGATSSSSKTSSTRA